MAENEAENQARKIARYAKNKRCAKCGGKLEIAAFTHGPTLTPVLLCEGKDCGTLYDIEEYGLTEEDILNMEE